MTTECGVEGKEVKSFYRRVREGFAKDAENARESYAEICAHPEHVVGDSSPILHVIA
jgi:hypothetical protein